MVLLSYTHNLAIFSSEILSSLSIPTVHHSISAYRQHPIESSKIPFPPHKLSHHTPYYTPRHHTIPHIRKERDKYRPPWGKNSLIYSVQLSPAPQPPQPAQNLRCTSLCLQPPTLRTRRQSHCSHTISLPRIPHSPSASSYPVQGQ